MDIDITFALFTLSLCILILNSQCKDGASDVNFHCGTPITKVNPDLNLEADIQTFLHTILVCQSGPTVSQRISSPKQSQK